ncbi:MAG: hypothetical protein K0S74_491 [Chlamydiales bacterium]|jgi:hypothetical protein|nr:hypothetical protein [Chlamydiales bacterium]
MEKRFKISCLSIFATSIFACSSLFALTTDISVSAGYRHDNIKHDLKFDVTSPTWGETAKGTVINQDTLNICDVSGSIKLLTEKNYVLQGAMDFGWVVGGVKEQLNSKGLTAGPVTTYALRHNLKKSSSKHGHMFDVAAAIGKQVEIMPNLMVIPSIGYARHCTSFNKFQSFPELVNSAEATHKVRWIGPFVKLELPYTIQDGISIRPYAEYHYARYESSLSGRSMMGRYTFTGTKWGNIYKAGISGSYAISNNIGIDLAYGFEYRSARPSNLSASIVVPDFKGSCSGKVKQKDHKINLGISYVF